MLEIRNLSLSIGQLKILSSVYLNIKKGETIGVIGPNGSGKTTLFNCISGFHYPSSGTMFFKGQNITKAPPYKRARLGLGRVFQSSGVFRTMTLLENMVTAYEGRQSLVSTFFPWSKQSRINREEGMQHLRDVGLDAKAHHKASSLSGGQLRLLEIVRALAFGSELLLLDEPTAGVSPIMKDDIAALIHKLRELGKTVLVIEHDITFIQKFCDRIVVLDSGEVILDDTPHAVRENPLLQEIYFGSKENSGSL